MVQDNRVISFLSPADMVALLRDTAGIAVLESAVADGRPVIHAVVKAVNAKTGEVLPGGLPFSVVMFKSGNEVGYSNIAIGTVVPAAELDIHLPRDYFNFCNQRLRFTRVFPLDASSFVIQMDLILHNATREYVKFNFGLWGMLFKQVLYELIGSGRESLVHAAEVYAATDVAQHFVSTLAASSETAEEGPANAEPSLGPVGETPVESEAPHTLPEAAIIAEDTAPQAAPEPSYEPSEDTASVLAEIPHVDAVHSEEAPAALRREPEMAHDETETHSFESRSENVMMMGDPAEGKDEPEVAVAAAQANDAEPFAVTMLDEPVTTVAAPEHRESEAMLSL